MLTDKQCKSAVCPTDKKRARFTDSGGLYLEVSPAGSKRWFWKIYADGKEGRLALGSYPTVGGWPMREGRVTRPGFRVRWRRLLAGSRPWPSRPI
jgi:hypothetical protein